MIPPLLFARSDIRPYCQYAHQHFPDLCHPRPADSHKGTFGTVAVLGGSRSMTGAAFLAAEAALYGGCGRVLVGLNQNPVPLVQARHELMVDNEYEILTHHSAIVKAWVVGCGLADNHSARETMKKVWQAKHAYLVLDAGALSIVAAYPEMFAAPRPGLVLTPHPGEAARLLDIGVAQVQSKRHWAARELASRYRAWVVLKGHESVISSPRGTLTVNPSGNAGLATAGSGDVLAGLTGSLLVQGLPPEQALAAAVWLHGAAADLLATAQTRPIGLLAGELAQAVRWLRNRLAAA